MRERSVGILLVAAAAAALAPSACGSSGSGGAGGGTTTASTSGTTSGSSSTGTGGSGGMTTTSSSATGGSGGTTTTSSTGSGGTSTSSSSSSGDAGVTYGYCTKPCTTAADCCPIGDPACPGTTYPHNVACTDSACYSPECSSTSDCTALDPDYDCFSLGGFEDCLTACASDTDCPAPQTCSGVDDNNKKFCLVAGGGCTDDASCSGFGKCVDKVCVCEDSNDCTKPGFTQCAKK
jgi:hypothetical protein